MMRVMMGEVKIVSCCTRQAAELEDSGMKIE